MTLAHSDHVSNPNATLTDRTALAEQSQIYVVLVAFAMAVAIFVRWWGLGKQSLWRDEGYTLWISQFPLKDIWRGVAADTSPPVFYFLMHGGIRLFGVSETALRSMSALFETLSLPVFFLLARRVLNNRIAVVIAVWLFALSGFQVQYAKDARFYGLLLFVALVSTL